MPRWSGLPYASGMGIDTGLASTGAGINLWLLGIALIAVIAGIALIVVRVVRGRSRPDTTPEAAQTDEVGAPPAKVGPEDQPTQPDAQDTDEDGNDT